ncbi:MAG: diadenylate cyclase CdaA [Clostridium sp.]|mgnify:FL=1|uniref:Diadenylate cyclase n=1 Tax=Anaeromassilibacillus senegalensis TaxID=1673717 RepID=A0ABS9MG90_9FIRM|nr:MULTISPECIES: diadenylate cyclase CdaA [Anaeromassilibacillus]MBS5622198.1 diadenylate cyclase CdaA [Clostridium sp.]MCG4609822.1 diadenylate cyclase CdaA [Anaeromassilibacillus senegalensis]OUO76351.1 TIGR00159 family protein [Anaeromassilibacillus sp. An250]HJB50808.1 diadenylate cyclase CdaA [Candidatus Anaeromassilibacillus stercoravium]
MDFITGLWDTFVALIHTFSLSDALDVLLVSFIIYNGIKLIRETRAEQLVKGIIILMGVYAASVVIHLNMMRTLLDYFFNFTIIALLVIFQPEIRRALEQIGRSKLGGKYWFQISSEEAEKALQKKRKCLNAVVEASGKFQKSKTGALMVFEMQTKLGDIIDTGTIVNAEPSVPLIGNIFWNKAPLHDGAMVIRDGVIYAAGCILPLTKSDTVSVDLGTRHRAAIGMSENSDAVVVVVSEETGQISIAVNGVLTRNYTRETLQSALEALLLPEENANGEKRTSRIPSIRRGRKS